MSINFNAGINPKIVLVDRTRAYPVADLTGLAVALRQYAALVAEHWGVGCESIEFSPTIPADCWAIVFLDDPDTAGAFGYHDLTAAGLPLSKVFTRVCHEAGENPSITASHELAEMLVDPACNLMAQKPGGVCYAYESADAVEEKPFITLAGLPLSNFILPAYFEGFRRSGRFDYLGVLKKPFSLAPGGYASIFKGGKWTQIFGSAAKARRFAKEDRRGHRSETRKAGVMKRSRAEKR